MSGKYDCFGKVARGQWFLDAECTYLNHGAYGALSREVFASAEKWRKAVEKQPSQFMGDVMPTALRASANRLGSYLEADGEDIVFVDNATTAINAVLRSLPLMPGDEVLTTDHAYGAILRTLEFVCDRADARLVQAPLPFPAHDSWEIVESVCDGFTPRTRLVVIDHVTSKSAMRLPIKDIINECRERDIPVLVDGAHAPGMLRFNLTQLGATWYAGNCHKWLGTPRGCGFLWTTKDRQSLLRPTTISHFVADGYTASFDWPGTKDFTPYLCVGDALDFREKFGEEAIRDYCYNLALRGGTLIANLLGVPLNAPENMLGFMVAVPLPEKAGAPTQEAANSLRRHIRNTYQTEIVMTPISGQLWMRISAYIYNDMDDFETLADILKKMQLV